MADMWSLVRGAIEWWIRELAWFVPVRVRAALRQNQKLLQIKLSDEKASLSLVSRGKVDDLGTIDIRNQLADRQRRDFENLARHHRRRGTQVNLRLNSEKCLQKRVRFPLAARGNLRQALSFEMDRLTPFRSEDVFYDYAVVATKPEEGSIELDLLVAPRKEVEVAIAQLSKWGVTANIVDVAKPDGAAEPAFNLLGSSSADKRIGVYKLIGSFLLGLALVQLAILLLLPLQHRREALDRLNSGVAAARTLAEKASRLRKDIAVVESRFESLYMKRKSAPYVSTLLLEVTRRLPDDTWIKALQFKDSHLTLSGYSRSSSAVLEALQRSPLVDAVAFTAPITLDDRLGVERFRLSGRISGSGQL